MHTETRPTPEAAGYRPGTAYPRCWNCESFTLPPGDPAEAAAAGDRPPVTCTLLGVPVEPTAVCDRWVQMADKARKRTGFRSARRQHGQFLWDEPGGGGRTGGGGGGPVGL